MEGYLTLAEMASALGLKNGAGLRRQVLRGALKAERVGKTYLVSTQEVERYRAVHLGQRGKRTPAPGRQARGAGGEHAEDAELPPRSGKPQSK